MTNLDYFNACTHGKWNNTSGDVSWKLENGVMYFQCTHGLRDWVRNLLVLPSYTKIRGEDLFIPLGLRTSWEEIEPIVRETPCIGYVGYSLGGEFASLSSAITRLPAIAFGCPNFYLGKETDIFNEVRYYTNSHDILANLPLGYKKGKFNVLLCRDYDRPSGVPVYEWFSHHSPAEYRLQLEDL